MTVDAPVRGERNQIVGHIRITAELSPHPRFYWRRDGAARWHEAAGLQEACARALGMTDVT